MTLSRTCARMRTVKGWSVYPFTMATAYSPRPPVITVLSLATVVVGLFFTMFAGYVTVNLVLSDTPGNATAGAFVMLIGLVVLGVGYGMYRGTTRMWLLALIASVMGVIAGVIVAVAGSIPLGIVLIVLCILTFYYLRHPDVKEFFGI